MMLLRGSHPTIEGGARPDGSPRWRTLSHDGVALPPPYDQLIPAGAGGVLWDGRPVAGLSAEARFFACEFVKRGGTVVELGRGRREARLFGATAPAARFWDDWRKMLPSGCPIASLSDARLDLSRLSVVPVATPAAVHQATPAAHAHALVDGKPQPVAPSAVDRPGIFLGRPGSDTSGRLRRRTLASDVTLNLGPGAPVPAGRWGGRWGGVVRDPRVDWIARWRDPVTRIVKYARLAPSSSGEQRAALARFDLARKLHARIHAFSRRVAAALASHDRRRKQLGVCLWLMWRLALRAGSGSPSDASRRDAHGTANLLVKHVVVLRDRRGVRLDFHGKDGVRYVRTLSGGAEDGPAANALAELVRGRDAEDPLFDRITSADAARAIAATLPGATPKVLRTMRATEVFRDALARVEQTACGGNNPSSSSSRCRLPDATARAALVTAGALAAALCNHRKGMPIDRASLDLATLDLATLERRIRDDVLKPLSSPGNAGQGRVIGRRLATIVREAGLSLATSRANYIDPRVAFAFARKHGVPPGYSKALLDRFGWVAAPNAPNAPIQS
jgi:DNA topoisomerase-1